jgi:hypothetical protein
MSWYKDSESESTVDTDTDTDGAVSVEDGDTGRVDTIDIDERQGRESSSEITVESDADKTAGRYSRDVPISFRESRQAAQTSREAREARGEAVEESPLPDLEEMDESVEEGRERPEESASTVGAGENDTAGGGDDAEARGEALKEQLDGEEAIEKANTLATGETHTTSYELVETTVQDESVFAMIETRTSGVAFQKMLGNYGTSVSTPSVAVDTDVLSDAVAGERKHRKRQTRYQDVDVVSELSEDQVSALERCYREVATGLIRCALLAPAEERARHDVSVSVVEDCVVVTGAGVSRKIADELREWMSEKQLSVVMDALPEAVEQSGELFSSQVRSEISRAATMSGECVVAGRLLLD